MLHFRRESGEDPLVGFFFRAAVELLIRSRGVLHDIESQNAPHGRIVERLDVEDIVLMALAGPDTC